MKLTDYYMMKYFGEGDLSAFDKIILAFDKEIDEVIIKELKRSQLQKARESFNKKKKSTKLKEVKHEAEFKRYT